MRRVVYVLAVCIWIVGGCGKPDPVHAFLEFVPLMPFNSAAHLDMERLVDQFTHNLDDYGNRTPGTITSKPLNANDGVYEIEWKLDDTQTGVRYDFQFKYLLKAGNIQGLNGDANFLMASLKGE